MKKFGPKIVVKCIVIAALIIGVVGSAVMFLWNNVLVDVVNVKPISFLQALGIFVLAKILFGGFKGKHEWKHRMRNKWHSMSDEERTKFREDWRNRCRGRGNWRGFGEDIRNENRGTGE